MKIYLAGAPYDRAVEAERLLKDIYIYRLLSYYYQLPIIFLWKKAMLNDNIFLQSVARKEDFKKK